MLHRDHFIEDMVQDTKKEIEYKDEKKLKLTFASPDDIETAVAIQIQNEYDFSRAKSAKKLVIFFEIAPYRMCGGQLSLFSYCKYSKQILGDNAEVLMSTIPGKHTYNHNNHFENEIEICRWEQIRELLKGKEEVILHIPEVDIVNPDNKKELFRSGLSREDFQLLRNIKQLHINIVNQQIELQPSSDKFSWFYALTDNVTMTVCNKTSSTQKCCNTVKMPLHLLPAYYDLANIKKVPLKEKRKLILLSPDCVCPLRYKCNFIYKINRELPEYQVFIIRNMKFEDYLRLTAASAAVVTFGEGFDGYLNNSPMLGTLGFAVYNDTFFPDKKMKDFPNIYSSWDDIYINFNSDIIKFMNNENLYYNIVEKNKKIIHNIYNVDDYKKALWRFYNHDYDFKYTEEKQA